MVYPFRKILKPMQFDDPELIAFQVAKQIAQEHNATLCLLHIVPIVPAIGEPHIGVTVHAHEEDRARKQLQEIADQNLAGVKYEIITRVADPSDIAEAVVKTARELDVDLIVMKTHGRHGLAHMIMGSVTEQVVREAPCAVMTLTGAAKAKFT